MIKKILLMLMLAITLCFSVSVCAADGDENATDIPSLTIEQLMALSKSKQAKVDIIKKNNKEIEKYKSNLSEQIKVAAEKINDLKIEVSENTTSISDEKLNELKNLLEFLQESTKTLNEDAHNVSQEIDEILDLILTKGMKLEQYDQIIEKQNTLIVKMKNILANVEKI
ncbi:MAG: hypothetical protein IKI57_06615 [Clostridia bacterium]|nr:hypothetical protein [Clostridia bacterium]